MYNFVCGSNIRFLSVRVPELYFSTLCMYFDYITDRPSSQMTVDCVIHYVTYYMSCSICIWNVVILFHIIVTCTEKELLWSLNIGFEIFMGISVFGYHKLKKVILFTKWRSVYMSYSALERNLFDRFPPNSQQKYKLGQYIELL